jgi:peptidoglycan hydrolase-like protein with peptidoglycan-binding domain
MQVYPTLREGDNTLKVVYRLHLQTLQRALLRAGFDPGPISLFLHPDNQIPPQTVAAVRGFQAANGIVANGIVGPETWLALPEENMQGLPRLELNSQGGAVAMVQRILLSASFDPGPFKGVFGPTTETAVKGYQQMMGIVVDGIVADQTWTTIAPFQLRPSMGTLKPN